MASTFFLFSSIYLIACYIFLFCCWRNKFTMSELARGGGGGDGGGGGGSGRGSTDAGTEKPVSASSLFTDLPVDKFQDFGDYAAAGQLAACEALAEAHRSFVAGRIPIAGAVVTRVSREGEGDGELTCVAVGHNGRIPPPPSSSNGEEQDEEHGEGPGPIGYPSDHGETGCVRCIADFAGVDWSSAVFATTLSPCVMCRRTIMHLHSLGLSRVVIAENKLFPGRKDLLTALVDPAMQAS